VNEPTYDEWMALSRTEYLRLVALLRDLAPDEWLRDTDCGGWRVREIVAHLVGAGESNASLREAARQVRLGRSLARGRDLVDGMNDVQVGDRSALTTGDLLAALRDVAPRAIAGRRAYPSPIRRVVVPFGPPVGTRSLGYLLGRIYTRDLWMHRVDIARATGRELVLSADHDAVLVADAVHEWAALHAAPYHLVLTGPAGGTFEGRDSAGETSVVLDAVDFMRGVSGRASDIRLLDTGVPF
jgi:uncharacterized protein (TIGR03083 family)